MTKNTTIEFWFDFASTYSYPTAMRIEALAKEKSVDIIWRPLLLGAIFNQYGWNDSPFNIYPIKGQYMWRDLQRICAKLNIDFQQPSRFPQNGILAARIATHFSGEEWAPRFIQNVFCANFQKDLDISSEQVIKDCLSGLLEDPDVIIKEAQTSEAKEKLRQQTEQAKELGIFGAPTFITGDELFWGNDRLEDTLEWVRNSR